MREYRDGGRGRREDIAEERRARMRRGSERGVGEGVRAAETHNECHS